MYIQSVLLEGKKWNKYYFPHEKLVNGGKLILKLGNKPNKEWGVE